MNQAITELTTPGISCGKRKADIEGDLASYPGIKQATADVATRRVHITHGQQRTSPATRPDYFPGRADGYGQAAGDHASSRTDPDNTERLTGICESEGRAGRGLLRPGGHLGGGPAGRRATAIGSLPGGRSPKEARPDANAAP